MAVRTYTNFSGGLNTFEGAFASPIILDQGATEALAYAEDSQNWNMSEAGLQGEPGYVAILASAVSGTPVITGEWDFNGTHIMCAGTKVYTVDGTTATEIYPAGGGGSAQTVGAFYQFTEYDDGSGNRIVVLCNGVDKPLIYNGTTCVQMSATDPSTIWNDARPSFSWPWRGSLLFGGDPTHPYRIYKPRPGTYNNFDNTLGTVDAFDVDSGFGGKVTGIRDFSNNFLVIYKERAIRRLSGSQPFGATTDPYSLLSLTSAYGCVAPRTLVGNDLNHFFLSEEGYKALYPTLTYGDADPSDPTYKIQDLVNGWNWSAISNACAVYDKTNKKIWLSVPNGASSTNNKIYHYKLVTKGLDPRGDGDIKAACLAYVNRGVNHGDYGGQIYRHGSVNNYNGTIISRLWTSKIIVHGSLGQLKKYTDLVLFADANAGGDIVVQWQILKIDMFKTGSATQQISDGSNAFDVAKWDQALWATGNQKILRINNLGKGHAIVLKFINASDSQLPKIRMVELWYDTAGNVNG